MFGFRLPVSGIRVVLRPPGGAEELLLAEPSTCYSALALALVSALVRDTDGRPLTWEALSTTDLDVALLRLRQCLIGDQVRADVPCSSSHCGERIDIAFRISDYLNHIRPKVPRGIERAKNTEWYVMPNQQVSFRLPSCADLVAIVDDPLAVNQLMQRCIRPFDIPARLRRRVESAMESIAPSVYNQLEGVCPACSTLTSIPFDPQRYVLHELRAQASSLYEEIHLLARHYHWSEQTILELPRARRRRYAESIYAERSVM